MRRDELSMPDPPANDRPGDRWACGIAGEPCARGPTASGTCCSQVGCQPTRTWHGRRRLIVNVALVMLAIVTVAWLLAPVGPNLLKPGELSSAHAQILAGSLASQRCASCHPASVTTMSGWWHSGDDSHHQQTQTDRCLECHHGTMPVSSAKLAHNLPRRQREAIGVRLVKGTKSSWHDALPRPAIDSENVQCSVCHVEHRGTDANLLAITDTQCQTCHQDRFGSFASSHPEFGSWPYGRGQQIAFNHATHAGRHFPATIRTGQGVAFLCVDCHQTTAGDELTRTVDYRRACAACHDASLQAETANGIELLTLPSLPARSMERIEPWPQWATGFFDGRIAPLAELLIRKDPQIGSSLKRIPDGDFSRIDPDQPQMVSAAESVARAHRRLLSDIAEQGQQVILDRAAGDGVQPATLAALVQSLPPQLIEEATRLWFGQPAEPFADTGALDVQRSKTLSQVLFQSEFDPLLSDGSLSGSLVAELADEDLLTDQLADDSDLLLADPLLAEPLLADPLLADPLLADPLTENGNADPSTDHDGIPERFDAERLLPAGGWYRDDARLSIRYRAAGHDDPVLKSTVQWLSQLRVGDPARESLLKTRAVAACIVCHPGAAERTGSWQSVSLVGASDQFTKFSHAPHMKISQLADCTHCHEVAAMVDHSTHDFVPMVRADCATCHTRQAAGDSCIRCHRYHIDGSHRDTNVARSPSLDFPLR